MVKWDSPVAWQGSEEVATLLNPSPKDAPGGRLENSAVAWGPPGKRFPPDILLPHNSLRFESIFGENLALRGQAGDSSGRVLNPEEGKA